jgi:hypothetical protein
VAAFGQGVRDAPEFGDELRGVFGLDLRFDRGGGFRGDRHKSTL